MSRNTTDIANELLAENSRLKAQLAELAKQEPIYQIEDADGWQDFTREEYESLMASGNIPSCYARLVFSRAAPPAPFVVKNFPARKSPSDYVDESFGNDDLAAIWNSCRLACKVKIQDAGGEVADE